MEKNLNILLENIRNQKSPFESNFTQDQILWLTEQGWERCRFKKMVSVQPMQQPASLVYFTDKGCINSEAVAAKTLKYNFNVFNRAGFDFMKEAYADAIAAELDYLIFKSLPKISLEVLREKNFLLKEELPRLYDYIIGPDLDLEGLDVYDIPAVLDPDSFVISVVAGKYPKTTLDLPIFAPYLLFTVGGKLGFSESLPVFLRYGWYPAAAKPVLED